MAKYYAEAYKITGFPVEKGIDIKDSQNRWDEILRKLYKEPVELCKWCSASPEPIEWCIKNNPDMEDWIVG